MNTNLSDLEMQALHDLASGRDPFGGCQARGDYGRCMLTLAALRRAGLIDHHDHLTEAGVALTRAAA